jgi:hypothetical protein
MYIIIFQKRPLSTNFFHSRGENEWYIGTQTERKKEARLHKLKQRSSLSENCEIAQQKGSFPCRPSSHAKLSFEKM